MDDLYKVLHQLIEALQAKNMTITSAESCTGGLIASFLTELAGSSAWFERGFVTYSNLAKQEMIGVDEALLRQHGAVSEIVAESMALGALQHSTADVSLSVTGIAGPDGGSALKPVGTVCFAWAMRGQGVRSKHWYFANASREEIRRLSCLQAFQGMSDWLRVC